MLIFKLIDMQILKKFCKGKFYQYIFLLFYKLYINLNIYLFSGEDIEEEPQEELTTEQRQGQ